MHQNQYPFILLILDGWGYREASADNAIKAANTPTWDQLWHRYPHALLDCSGMDVGLPDRQMGNSEVGHIHIGAGRQVHQPYSRINHAISTGEFAANAALLASIEAALRNQSALHIIGLLSDGGIHSHQQHTLALIELAAAHGITNICLHAFLDGRDTAPKSALASLTACEQRLTELQCGAIKSISGRFYAMDRDHRWSRTERVYNLLALSQADYQADSASHALALAYERGETDEFVTPTIINEATAINDSDSVIFMNFRADRARQLSYALQQVDFVGFERQRQPRIHFTTLTQYADELACNVAFPPESLSNVLGAVIAEHGLRQLRIAETEKYAHVTFFINGGVEAKFKREQRLLVPSPQVETYDLEPSMSAPTVTQHIVEAIQTKSADVIICNFANPDMVGHTGNYQAAIAAVESIDQCLQQIVTALQQHGGELLITADHGNVEEMYDHTKQQPLTAHTTNPVPLVYLGRAGNLSNGRLSDIAPTILHLLGIDKPAEMTGQCLVTLTDE